MKDRRIAVGLIVVLAFAGLLSMGSLCDLIALTNHNVTFQAIAQCNLHDKKNDQWVPASGIRVYFTIAKLVNGVPYQPSERTLGTNADIFGEATTFFTFYLNRSTTGDRGYTEGAYVIASAEYEGKTKEDTVTDVPLSWVTEQDTENIHCYLLIDTL